MSYQRFDVSKIGLGSATAATVATVATVSPEKAPSVANVASVASQQPASGHLSAEDWQAAHEERAAIIEHDGGAPREWAEGFARLDCSTPPPGFSPRSWEQLINDGGRFMDRWATEAARLGWTAEDVFGVHPSASGARVDAMGLVPLIGGGEVVSISGDRASIRMPGGSTLTYLRRARPKAVALWDLCP
jgi:hypothetical protein